MIDCYLVGFNEVDLGAYVRTLSAMGRDQGAYRDLDLAFVTHDSTPYTCMDVIDLFRRQDGLGEGRLSNADFLWPVITYLYTYLTRRGFSVEYANLYRDEREHMIELLRGGEVRSVAITTTLYVWMGPILEIVADVRRHSPETTIIVGGPYVHNQAQLLEPAELRALLVSLGADVLVVSAEGEETLARVLSALRRSDPLDDIANLVYRDGDEVRQTPLVAESNDLEDNMVDYRLFDGATFRGMVSLRTAKSCPFSCAFCAFPRRAGRYAYLPVAAVERELDAVRATDSVTTLSFLDDTFNVPPKRFKEILRMMIRNGYGFRWNSYLRADHADDECIGLMRDSGCEGVFLGVESGSDRMLKAMNKTARRADYLRVVSRLRDAGILSHANVIVGFPGETEDSVGETTDLLETARPDFYRAQLWYCDPTTPVWERRGELGIRGSGFTWSHATMDAATAAHLVEHLFLTIEGSTWLPQHGFETWSLYYLQRRGLSLELIRGIVAAFNDAVRAKIVDPQRQEVPPEAWAALRAAWQRAAPAFCNPRREARHACSD